jgi:Ni,Fe-hydrogenase III small subunit
MQTIPISQGKGPAAAPLPRTAANQSRMPGGNGICLCGSLPPGGHRCGAKTIDMGRCVFCGTCERIVGKGRFVTFTQDFAIAVAEKEHLITAGDIPDLAAHSRQHFKKLFGRSLQLRQVSAAGCNACEADLNVLATPFFDLARFGINFVASPRHADGIVVTGPISRNMKTALLKTYEATPEPRVVIAVGSCTISGGPFLGQSRNHRGAGRLCRWTCSFPAARPTP